MMHVESYGDVTFLRLARGVLGRGIYWTGCYYYDGLLLDCGPPATADALLAFVESRPLAGVVLSHHHEDHTGAAAALLARRGVPAHIHADGIALVRDGFEQQLYRRIAWGRQPRVTLAPLASTFDGQRERFEVHPTPGHSPDHVCLFVPERGYLFTGDLFLAERLRFLRRDEDLLGLIESLERMAVLPVERVFCAHRGLVKGGTSALHRKAEHLRGLRDGILEGLRRGQDPAALARRLVGREGLLSLLSLGHFSARNFVNVLAEASGAAVGPAPRTGEGA